MLIHPWDAAVDAPEWQAWLATTDRFGILAVNNLDPAQAPVVLPTHFTLDGPDLLIHLARPNQAWPHLQAATEVSVTVIGDYAYIPTYWRAAADVPAENGVPTSYYSAVQFVCRPTIVDDPDAKAALLATQLADFQPEGRYADTADDNGPYARMLSGIRGARLAIQRVEAKFKYDDHKPAAHREHVSDNLDQRGHGLDSAAAAQQRRRLSTIGDWKAQR